MLAETKKIVKQNKDKIYLFIVILLIALIAFSLGWIFARKEAQKPLDFEYERSI